MGGIPYTDTIFMDSSGNLTSVLISSALSLKVVDDEFDMSVVNVSLLDLNVTCT